MVVFWPHVVRPLLEAAAPDVIVEIGVDRGATTEKLLDFSSQHGSTVHAIDPSPAETFDLQGFQARHGDRLVFHRRRSLEVLPQIGSADAVLIDGDHNWYTVFHELQAIARNAADANEELPLTLLHDVDWPYGRRDLYYDPESIPDEHRQPFERSGLVFGEDRLAPSGANPNGWHAVAQGTPRNGVRTAVEDFLEESGQELHFQSVSGFTGLGILVSERRLSDTEALRRVVGELASVPALLKQCELLETARLSTHRRLREVHRDLASARQAQLELRRRLRASQG